MDIKAKGVISMSLIKRVVLKYKRWRFRHATPAERGNLLHEHYIPGNYKVGTGCEFLTQTVPFGSEPYLIEIGDNVRITSGVKFCTHDGGLWVLRHNGMLENADYFGRIKIEDNVHIGWDTIIMPGVTIGHDSIIGVGGVVTRNIPPRSVAVGVPARVIESIDDYYEKYKDRVDFIKNLSESEKEKYLMEKFGLGEIE